MLKEFSIKNLSVFPDAQLTFSSSLNVILGEDGCGKSHLLKVAYVVISISAEGGKNKADDRQTPKAYRRRGQRSWSISCVRSPWGDWRVAVATSSKSKVQIEQPPSAWHPDASVFLSTRELLTIYPNFISIYETTIWSSRRPIGISAYC